MSRTWSREEVEATVADYFHMLTLELAAQQYNKTEHRHALLTKLDDRTNAAVELKHQNISAILLELVIDIYRDTSRWGITSHSCLM